MNASENSQTQIPDGAEIGERKLMISYAFNLLVQLWVFHTSTSVLCKIFVGFLRAGIIELVTQNSFKERDLMRSNSQKGIYL